MAKDSLVDPAARDKYLLQGPSSVRFSTLPATTDISG
jgi:hypothetical protein